MGFLWLRPVFVTKELAQVTEQGMKCKTGCMSLLNPAPKSCTQHMWVFGMVFWDGLGCTNLCSTSTAPQLVVRTFQQQEFGDKFCDKAQQKLSKYFNSIKQLVHMNAWKHLYSLNPSSFEA